MAVGAEIYTNGGAIQIGSDYATLCLRQTGRATLSSLHPTANNAIGVKARTVDVTYNGQASSTPLFAMSKTGAAGDYGVIAVERAGDTWTFRVIGDERFPTFDYFIFDIPSPTPNGAGFEVYSETGEITFSSYYRPLEVHGFIPSLTGSASVSSNRQYAIAFSGYISENITEEWNSLNQRWWHWQHDLVVAGVYGSTASIFHNMINGGSERNDNQQPTLPRPSGGLGNWGAGSGALVIDVTDLTGVVTPPSSISVSVNATSRTASSSEQSTITDAVTASASGHSGTLSYQWEKVGGSSAVNIYGSSTTASLRTQVNSLAVGSSVSGQFRCVVTSSSGQIGYSLIVTFTHIRTAHTNQPNPISLPRFNVVSNDHDVWANGTPFQITGISVPIQLRFERYYFSSPNGMALYHDIFKGPTSSGPWTHLGYFDSSANGQRYLDHTANNGDWFRFDAHAITTSGRRSATVDLVVWNLTRSEQLSNVANNSFVVDNDNNYNTIDVTPDAMSWPNVSWSTPNNVVYGAYPANGPRVTGINAPITLRFQFTSASSNTTWQNFEITNYSHNTHATITNYTTGSYADVVVANNDTFICKVSCGSDSGIRNTSGTVRVTNLSDNNAVVGTFNVNVTVDNDDNYNKAIYDLNPIDWGNVWFSTNNAVGEGQNTARGMGGINRNIVLSGGIFNLVGDAAGTIYAISTTRGVLASHPFRLGGWLPFEVQPNEQIYFKVDAFTDSGRKEFGFDFQVYNHTTGAHIDHLYCSGIVDADDNHNKGQPLSVTVSPTYLNPGWEYVNEGTMHTQYIGRSNVTVNGGTGPYTHTWERVSGSGFSVSNTGTYADFYYSARTNFVASGTYRLKVTDSKGAVVYSQSVSLYAEAGNILN